MSARGPHLEGRIWEEKIAFESIQSLFGIQYLPGSITEEVASHPDIRSRRYAVIGAGAAGLCAIKYLKQAGAENITCYEIGTKIGGLWCYENDSGTSSAYRTLHINTARTFTRFSHLDLPSHVQDFPHHTEIHRYLQDFADAFGLRDHIRFKSKVVDVRRAQDYCEDAPRWEVETESRDVEAFDCVIVATGHLTEPRHLEEFRKAFTGTYMHSHYYRKPEDYIGKRLCIVGAANSAFDMAADTCVIAKRTVLVARSGVIVTPKTVFGVPFRDITMQFDRPFVPHVIRRKVNSFLIWLAHGNMTKLGFKPQKLRQHTTSNGTLVNHINYQRIEIKHGIEEISGQQITFDDGTSGEFDVLVASTGYDLRFPFLGDDILPRDEPTVDLYKRMKRPGQGGLYFLGYVNTSTALFQMFEHQMKWILSFDSQEAEHPTEEEMWRDIEAKKRQIATLFGTSPRYDLEEPHLIYLPELYRSIKEGVGRKRQSVR